MLQCMNTAAANETYQDFTYFLSVKLCHSQCFRELNEGPWGVKYTKDFLVCNTREPEGIYENNIQ